MSKEAITIGIVDDHKMFRKAVIHFINQFENCLVTLEAGNGKELQEKLKAAAAPDIVLLDINMPVLNGYRTMDWLHENFPDLPVIIVSGCDHDLTLSRLMEAGARAYLKKDSLADDELKHAIYSVKQHGFYFNDPISRRLFTAHGSPGNKQETKPLWFTKNEWIFLELISTDLTYLQIALKMGISKSSIDKIRAKMFEKLQVESRVGLSVKAIRNGIQAEAN
jgi:two-component system invasion response regulator UvrY